MKNQLKEKLRSGGTAVGCWVGLNSPAVTEVLAGAGYDALLIDYEHGEGSVADLVHHLRAARGSETTILVRVPNDSPHEIKRALDCGASGIMVPGVETADQAQRIVDQCRYPPEGRRGAAGSIRAGRYGQDWKDYVATANDAVMVLCQIESREAVARIAEIAIPGVDSLFLGPMDLSGSIGKLGQFDDPEVIALRADAERAILATDAVLGTIETAAGGYDRLAAKGYRLIFSTSDVALLRNGPAGLTAKIT
jgi:2-keto-3-deoxy-L-rhamnonate aldolase RhmA